MEVLDLFSAAAGGWSLGMHRAGFKTIAACENVEWRRALYQQNNPGVLIYDDVCSLTADRIVSDLGRLPSIVVGSPPCQDISPANTKGKGVEGERSGLYFQAVRIIGEVRPRWFALENSANLRTRGADLVLAALEELGYACWSFVVRAGDGKGGAGIGANHERPRSWLIGCDIDQLTDPDCDPVWQSVISERSFAQAAVSRNLAGHAAEVGCGAGLSRGRVGAVAGSEQSPCGDAVHAAGIGHEGGRSWGHGPDGHSAPPTPEGSGRSPHADQAGQADGPLESSLQQAQEPDDGRGARRSDDGQSSGEVGLCEADRGDAFGRRADWSLDDLADHLQLDDGLSAWLAGTRIAVGGPRGTVAASLIVEAFGDAVVPQIPEAIGRAILRTEQALAAVYRSAA